MGVPVSGDWSVSAQTQHHESFHCLFGHCCCLWGCQALHSCPGCCWSTSTECPGRWSSSQCWSDHQCCRGWCQNSWCHPSWLRRWCLCWISLCKCLFRLSLCPLRQERGRG